MTTNNNKEEITTLDQDLHDSRLAKYHNAKLINETKNWILKIAGSRINSTNFQSDDLIKSLKDGTILCELINAVWGSNSLRFKKSPMAFIQMENIEKFLTFIKSNGVAEDELFQTVDLYESKDPYQVVMTLEALSRVVDKKFPSKHYGVIGPKIAQRHHRPPIPIKPAFLKGETPWSTIEYGYMKGDNQQQEHIVFGKRRDITNNQ